MRYKLRHVDISDVQCSINLTGMQRPDSEDMASASAISRSFHIMEPHHQQPASGSSARGTGPYLRTSSQSAAYPCRRRREARVGRFTGVPGRFAGRAADSSIPARAEMDSSAATSVECGTISRTSGLLSASTPPRPDRSAASANAAPEWPARQNLRRHRVTLVNPAVPRPQWRHRRLRLASMVRTNRLALFAQQHVSRTQQTVSWMTLHTSPGSAHGGSRNYTRAPVGCGPGVGVGWRSAMWPERTGNHPEMTYGMPGTNVGTSTVICQTDIRRESASGTGCRAHLVPLTAGDGYRLSI